MSAGLGAGLSVPPQSDRSAVELRAVTKRYGTVVACRGVSLSIDRGEIHGLLGENGAGKTTLMKVLIGLVQLDGGEIRIGGRPVVVSDPVHATSLGLAMAQQHLSLVDRLRVWENVALAHRGGLRKSEAVRAVQEVTERYGLVVDSNVRVEELTVGQRQRVELVKCLTLKPEVLILDEPTSLLTAAESRDLFKVLRQVVEHDELSVILISHKLDEVLDATDRVTIMRDGVVVGSMKTSEADAHQLARAMVGREVLLQAEMAAVGLLDEKSAADANGLADELAKVVSDTHAPLPALRLSDVEVRSPEGNRLLDGFSVEVARGEIVGVAGVEGNGQSTLGDLMSGIVTPSAGTIEVEGREVPARASALLDARVSVIPDDRHKSGCVLRMSVAENLVASDLGRFMRGGILLNGSAIRKRAQELIDEYDIATPSPQTPMAALSGGSQQRVVVARELSRDPVILVAVQPTRGLDVGAIEYMSEQLRAAAARGVGILLVSTEIDEILAIANRIVVIHAGRNVGEMTRQSVNMERLGLLMGGHVA